MYKEDILIVDQVVESDGSRIIYQYQVKDCQVDLNSSKQIKIEGEFRDSKALFIIKLPSKTKESYVKPKVWCNLSKEDKVNSFTLREGQILLLSSVYIEVDSLEEVLVDYDYSFRVNRVDSYLTSLPHLEVFCS